MFQLYIPGTAPKNDISNITDRAVINISPEQRAVSKSLKILIIKDQYIKEPGMWFRI